MKTKKLLQSATSENAAEVIKTALERKWTPEQILAHGNDAVKAQLGKASSATVAVLPSKRKSKGKVKPKAKPNTSKARPVQFAADFTPYGGGMSVQELVNGKRGIIGPRGAQYADLVTESGRKFRLSASAFDRLVEDKKRVLSWVDGKGTYLTLA